MITGTARRTLVNFASLLSSEALSKVLQFALFIYLARMLGAEQFGIFSFSLAFGFIFIILVDFGFSQLIVREMSREKKKAPLFLGHALLAKVGFSLVTVVLAWIFLNVLQYSNEVKVVAMVMLAFTILQTFTELHSAVFKAFEQMQYEAIIKVGRMVILVGGVVYAVENGYSLATAALIFVITEVLALFVAGLIVYSRFVRLQWLFQWEFLKKLVKKSSVFCLSFAFGILYLYIDSVMLSKMKGVTEVGLYAAAANLVIALIFIPLMFMQSLFPVMSRLHISSKKTLRFIVERSLKYMFLLGLAACVGIFMFAEDIIGLLYGHEYASSAVILKVLCWYLFLKFLNIVIGTTLMSINRQKRRLLCQGSAAALNIVLNIILIPSYGMMGAAAATLLTEIVFFSLYVYSIIEYKFSLRFFPPIVVKGGVCVLVMAGILVFIPSLFLAVVAGPIIFLGAILIMGLVDKQDRAIWDKIRENV